MELTPATAPSWLAAHGFPGCHHGGCMELGGGVSNKVILAEWPSPTELPGSVPCRIVLKQSLGQLRVEREWLSDPARIFREAAAMRWLRGRAQGGRVPGLLAEDPANFCIAMESAPADAEMWKTRLFRREFSVTAARAAGALLGSVIAASWRNGEAANLFGDQTVFDELRIDPYYRFLARHAEVAPFVQTLITRSAARRVSLVHGDWSPKNLLVSGAGIWAIDWEVVHFGDPAFDVAFLLNHLLLKTVAMPAHREALASLAAAFLHSLRQALDAGLPHDSPAAWIEAAALEHLPALVLARVDGKSPAEYLDAPLRATAWQLGLSLITHPASSVAEVFER